MELSGIWGFNDVPFLDLAFDGSQGVSGTTYWRSDGRAAQAAIEKGFFDPATKALRLEGDAPSLDADGVVHYLIEGSLHDDTLSGTYGYGGFRGNFIFTRIRAR